MQLFGSLVLGVFGAIVCLPVELALLTQLALVQGELFCLAWQFEDQRIANRGGLRGLGVVDDAIDAKQVLVLDVLSRAVPDTTGNRLKDVEPPVEVADPEFPGGVHRKRGDIAVGQNRARRL